MSRRAADVAAVGLGAVVLAGALVVGARDVHRAAQAWSSLGPLGPGDAIPSFRAQLVGDGELDPAALEGRVTLLAFWASWCGVCEQQMPAIEALHRAHASRGLRVIGVNQDRVADQDGLVRAYARERGLDFEMALDTGPVGRAFRISMIPHVVLVDRHGDVRHVHQGRVGESTLVEEVDALLSE
jgi:thiol-disulfide isomerase/thioredoxin